MSLTILLCSLESGQKMHNGGLHPSLDEPPKTTMFAHAGGGQAAKKKASADPLTQAISQLAAAISLPLPHTLVEELHWGC